MLAFLLAYALSVAEKLHFLLVGVDLHFREVFASVDVPSSTDVDERLL